MHAVLPQTVWQRLELVVSDVQNFECLQVMHLDGELSQLVAGNTELFEQS